MSEGFGDIFAHSSLLRRNYDLYHVFMYRSFLLLNLIIVLQCNYHLSLFLWALFSHILIWIFPYLSLSFVSISFYCSVRCTLTSSSMLYFFLHFVLVYFTIFAVFSFSLIKQSISLLCCMSFSLDSKVFNIQIRPLSFFDFKTK